jgi:hypothetical protein
VTWDNAVGGRQGDNVTTTGGPEHSLVDPALGSETAGEPILDGDDIVVEPSHPVSHVHRRTRELAVAIVVGVLIVIGVAVAIATRGGSGSNTHVTSSAPVHPPAASLPVKKAGVATKPRATSATAPAHVSVPPAIIVPPITPTAPAGSVVPPVTAHAPVSVVQPTTPPTTPTQTAPPAEPPSVLRWTTSPSAISIKAGGSAFLTVTVVNPTAGTVTLGHPMSCPPTLETANGTPIGGAVCEAMAQVMAPHSQVVAHYTIYATDTADASGAPLAPGEYSAYIENLHNVKVTVTAS